MIGAAVPRARVVLTAFVAALVLPAVALAQGGPGAGIQRPEDPTSEQTARGGLAATGFEVWQIALLGVVLVAVALVLLRGVRTRGSEAA